MKSDLYIVYCIDTEEPIHEPLEATFDRLFHLYGVRLGATQANLNKIQKRNRSTWFRK